MNLALLKNILDILAHVVITTICCLLIFLKTGNLGYVFIFIAGGIFIDLDHLVDHFLHFKDKFSLDAFFSSKFVESGKVYIFMHSWELTLLLYITGLAVKSAGLITLSAGLAVHLATDCLIKRKFLAYCLAYRIANKFDARIFS